MEPIISLNKAIEKAEKNIINNIPPFVIKAINRLIEINVERSLAIYPDNKLFCFEITKEQAKQYIKQEAINDYFEKHPEAETYEQKFEERWFWFEKLYSMNGWNVERVNGERWIFQGVR